MDKGVIYTIVGTQETFLGGFSNKEILKNVSLSDWENFKANLDISKSEFIEVSLYRYSSGVDEKTEAPFTCLDIVDKIRKYKRKNKY